jgi:hypothetical protein
MTIVSFFGFGLMSVEGWLGGSTVADSVMGTV